MRKKQSAPRVTPSSVQIAKDQRGQTETSLPPNNSSISSSCTSHKEVRMDSPSPAPVSPRGTRSTVSNPANYVAKSRKPTTPKTPNRGQDKLPANNDVIKTMNETTAHPSSSTLSTTAPSSAAASESLETSSVLHITSTNPPLSSAHQLDPADRTTSWALRINNLMNRRTFYPAPSATKDAISNSNSDDYNGDESDAYLKMDQYDFMNVSEMVQSEKATMAQNFSTEGSIDENSTIRSDGGLSSSAFSFQLFRAVSSSTSPRKQQQQEQQQTEYFDDSMMRVRKQSQQQPYGDDDSFSKGSNGSMSDFQDWTPQDSAYGAACPVCGWIPKNIRQLIEYTLLTLIIFSIVYLIVTTSIRISSSSSSSSSNNANLVDDDYFVEWGESYSGSADEEESVDDDDDYLYSRRLPRTQHFRYKRLQHQRQLWKTLLDE
eukprot:CAMPEP_0195286088 /NCGR_PEP_ID=MMETSP0707-20130614/3677_1 /TAXON_ID=33640 /ORGANISM="Asterionellopsis glacialis, Strain CCMP134" /LENGTH=431 /DNA_ID=CAMNT_0040345681 /DNA_START=113 /DNA_END=1408 /DNA_ORIENTATION=-